MLFFVLALLASHILCSCGLSCVLLVCSSVCPTI
nr:MAG TPA: hypothetical protein [Caudoviricetes sp.]